MNAPESAAGSAGGVCVGNVQFLDDELARISDAQGPAAAWAAAFARFGMDAPSRVRGDFAVAVRDSAGRTLLAVDRFAIRTLCYRVERGELRVAERADELGDATDIDTQAIFDYLYFHVIPAPRTVFREVHRLAAGHCALFEAGKLTVKRWWNPVFAQDRKQSLAALSQEFRDLLHGAVAERSNRGRVGCFLSGGTDSSTVAGMLGLATHSPPQTFSIGFDAKGYDEMAYARIAAKHFNAAHHEYYVTPGDVAHSIPAIAAACDQPFGNSSVIPAYYCARMARDTGIDTMLAGDGGDELFGGNTRYVRQRILAIYDYLPGVVRKSVLEPVLAGRGEGARIPGLGKAQSYVEQARVPMPDRMHGYNLLLRIGLADVLTPGFLSSVDPELPLQQQRDTYAASAGTTLVNRMLAYDWKYTLADNDLPKVNVATALAGVAASYPMLDDRLVDFSLRLPSSLKVKGVSLRWFFKKALRGFLPAAIIAKRKHGFGLPFGVWMTQDAHLKAVAMDSLGLLRNQGIVRTDFLDRLTGELLPQHPGYYGEMVWILMMLAQWNATRPRRAPPAQGDAR